MGVKADIEGMEIPMIAGGEETLTRTRAPISLEFDTVVLPEYNLLDCLRILGYNTYAGYFPVWNQHNFRKTEQPLWLDGQQNGPGGSAFRAVMIREPEQKKEQQRRRSVSKLSPWS